VPNNWPIIGWLPTDTKSYKNLMFLPFEIEKSCRITVKPALGDYPFVKLKVVTQNRWSLNDGSLTGQVLLSVLWVCDLLKNKWQLANTVVVISRQRLSAKRPIISASLFSIVCKWINTHQTFWTVHSVALRCCWSLHSCVHQICYFQSTLKHTIQRYRYQHVTRFVAIMRR